MSAVSEAVKTALNEPLKLDVGCGKNKQPGFIGIDQYDFDGVDIVADLRSPRWHAKKVPDSIKPRLVEHMNARVETTSWSFKEDSVDEIHCSHFLEHLTNLNDRWERVHFFNECYRIMKPGAQMRIVFPHWSSHRFYGDPTHKEPFSEMGFLYLNKNWRLNLNNAPHADISVNPNGYTCDFDPTWVVSYETQRFAGRSAEYVQYALQNYKDVAMDIHATLTKPAHPR